MAKHLDEQGDSDNDYDEVLNPALSIECSTRSDFVGSWILCGFWLGLTVYIFSQINVFETDWQRDGIVIGLLVAVFAGGSLYLLATSVLVTLQWRKYAKSILQLQGAAIGEPLRGVIRTSNPLKGSATAELRLECFETETYHVRGKQKKRTHSLWKSDKRTPVVMRQASSEIPIDFDLPKSCRGVDDSRGKGKVSWKLSAKVVQAGVDYEVVFDVPICSQE
jgi:hypothetical protein